jgi:hypothetical protein
MRLLARSLAPALFALLASTAASAATPAGVAPADATPVQREEAQTHFGRGHDLYGTKKYEEAAAEFERSYAIVASPNALFFLARCDRERGRLVDAYAEMGRAATEAREHAAEDPRYEKTAEAAIEEREAITPRLGFVTITVNGGSAGTIVLLGGERFPRAALGDAIPVMPGSTTVVLETPGSAPVRQTVSVFAGENKPVTIDVSATAPPASQASAAAAEPPPPHVETPQDRENARKKLRYISYGSAGLAVAGFSTFAIAGIASNNTYNDLQAQCHGPCPPGQGNQDEISRGKTQQTIADVGLVVGIVGAGAAVTLFVMSIPSTADKVSAVVGPAWMGFKGAF